MRLNYAKDAATRTALLAGACVLTGCFDRAVDLEIDVTVPSEIVQVDSGMLTASLWVYATGVMDAPADLADADSITFAHTSGVPNQFRIGLKGSEPWGYKHYITIRGYELSPGCRKYILWDGLEGVRAPTVVVMKPIKVPTCVNVLIALPAGSG